MAAQHHDPLVADEQRALFRQLPVVFLLQLGADRRQIPCITRDVLVSPVYRLLVERLALREAVVPVERERRQPAARQELPADTAAHRPIVVAAAVGLFQFDRRRVRELERPIGVVDDVAAHVADRPVAEVAPRMPVMRMQAVVIVAIGRGTQPRLPVEPLRHRTHRRPRDAGREPVRAVGPAVNGVHLTDRAGGDIFAQQAAAFARLALVAHLGDHAVTPRLGDELPRLFDRVCQRFLDINVEAEPDGQQRRQRVLMVGRGDQYGVQLTPHRVKQPAVISEGADRGGVGRGRHLAYPFQSRIKPMLVRIHDRDEPLFTQGGNVDSNPLQAAADQRHAQRLLFGRRDLAARARDHEAPHRGRCLNKRSPPPVD